MTRLRAVAVRRLVTVDEALWKAAVQIHLNAVALSQLFRVETVYMQSRAKA
jgi:hypothetical protein